MSVRDACEDTLSARVKSAFSLMADLCFAQERAIMPHKKSIHGYGNPNSLASLQKSPSWVGGDNPDASIAGTKGGKVSGRTTVSVDYIAKKIMQKKGSLAAIKYLENQGFHLKSRKTQELLMFRVIERAIKEADPLCMAQIFFICQTGKTIEGGKNAPLTGPSPDGINRNTLLEVVLETKTIWQNNHRKAGRVKTVKPPRVKPPRVELPKL